MATKNLSVKFSTEGFNETIASMKKVAVGFDEALGKSQKALKEAIAASKTALTQGDQRAFEAAEKAKEKAARSASRAIQGAYRELRIKSEADIEAQKRQLISAFEAIRRSGTASAKDIANAQAALKTKLAELDGQVKKTESGFSIFRATVAGVFSQAIVQGVSWVSNALQNLGANVIQTGAAAEKQAVAFETFLGSASKAKQVLQEVSDFAATTPFELPEVTEAAKQLLAVKVPADELISTISMLGEIAAGTDKPLSQLLFTYVQIKNQGKATAEEINQLTNAGISMYDFSKALGIAESQVKELASKGKIGFAEVEKVLRSMTSEGGRFYGLMEKLGGTTAVKLSNLNDAFTKIYKSIYQGISPAISAVLDVIVATLNPLGENQELWGEINKEAENFKNYIKDNPQIAEELNRALTAGVKVALQAASQAAKEMLSYLRQNPDAIASAVRQLGTLVSLMQKFIQLTSLSISGWQQIADLIGLAGRRLSSNPNTGQPVLTGPTTEAELKGAGATGTDREWVEAEISRRIERMRAAGINVDNEMYEIVRRQVVNAEKRRLAQARGEGRRQGATTTKPAATPRKPRSSTTTTTPAKKPPASRRTAATRRARVSRQPAEIRGRQEQEVDPQLEAQRRDLERQRLSLQQERLRYEREDMIRDRADDARRRQEQLAEEEERKREEAARKREEAIQLRRDLADESRGLASSQRGIISGIQSRRLELQGGEQIPYQQLKSEYNEIIDNLNAQASAIGDLARRKQELGESYAAESALMAELQTQYKELISLYKLEQDVLASNAYRESYQQKLALFDLDTQIAEAKAQQLQREGKGAEAAEIRKNIVLSQEYLRYQQQILDIREQYKNQPGIIDALVGKAGELNRLNIANLTAEIEKLEGLGQQLNGVFENAFGNLLINVFDSKNAFADFASSILNNLAQMAAKFAASQLFNGLLGGNLGGIFGGLPGFAQGGLVLGAGGEDSVIGRLTPGELVLPPDITGRLLQGAYTQNAPTNINISVRTPDVGGFKASERQIGQMIGEYVRRSS